MTERVLFNEDRPVLLSPKAFETLLALVQQKGHVLTPEELVVEVWPDGFVELNNLAQNISTLRKVLSESKFIETVPKRGYRLIGDVREIREETPNPKFWFPALLRISLAGSAIGFGEKESRRSPTFPAIGDSLLLNEKQ